MISRVVPLFPGFWEPGLCGVSFDSTDELIVEDDKSAEDVVVVAVRKIFCDTVNGDNESNDLENSPYVSKRLRTFHIV